ncbi:hypothetical protein NH340_JMT08456 [Sarcoptes scabiei]|nr:hypothetical protein NH340_JMT08456 [Sarcoptes scabiei]
MTRIAILLNFSILIAMTQQWPDSSLTNENPPTPMSHYILSDLYKDWTKIFRRNHQYRNLHLQRKIEERSLLSIMESFENQLHSEMLSMMQQIGCRRIAINTDRKFEFDDFIENYQFNIDGYLRWLVEMKNLTKQTCNKLLTSKF